MIDISRELLAQASKGDIRAFEEIYRAAAGFVYTVSLKMTCNSADAEEITQDVFLKIYENLGSFRFRASFKTWVYRITVNTALNAIRRRDREPKGDLDTVLKTASSKETARDSLEQEERKEKVAALLSSLNPDQRTCLVLREIEGLSYKEIASVLRININTVRTRIKRARQALMNLGKSRMVKDEV